MLLKRMVLPEKRGRIASRFGTGSGDRDSVQRPIKRRIPHLINRLEKLFEFGTQRVIEEGKTQKRKREAKRESGPRAERATGAAKAANCSRSTIPSRGL